LEYAIVIALHGNRGYANAPDGYVTGTFYQTKIKRPEIV
jgi:hypothetical protein